MKSLNYYINFTFSNLVWTKCRRLNNQSKELIQQGKYNEAFPILKESAELGNSEAQYNLGYFLRKAVKYFFVLPF